MGSSKKHKEKDRDASYGTGGSEDRHREHKKHKHKDRERERRKRSREREKTRDRDGRPRSSKDSESRKIKKAMMDPDYEQGVAPKSSGGDSSLTIEETNKLRAKLGLKPLELNTIKTESGTKEDPVAAAIINPLVLRQQQELREKLAAAKEKRLLNQKLGKIKSLGEDELWLDDTAAWIERSRKLQAEKEKAEKRAKLLAEMDEEFGVSNLVEEEFGQKKTYSSHDLQGLTVEHNLESFAEGQAVILTLKDKGVLDEDESDVLVNVNMIDKEKAAKNVELRKKRPDYKPYEEEESVDDMVVFRHKSVLSKYDEEIEGEKKKSFRLESGGTADGSWEKELQNIRQSLHNQAQSLEIPALKIASEYYTPDEMVTFKKTKRRVKKIRKKEKSVVTDDLLLIKPDTRRSDFGSRTRGRGRKRAGSDDEEREVELKAAIPQSDDVRVESMDISDEEAPGSPSVLEEDDLEVELHKQLEKSRRLKQIQQQKDSSEKIAAMVKKLNTQKSQDEDDDDDKKGSIVFNATSEFCRTLGEIPTYGLAGNREDQEDLMDFDKDKEESENEHGDSEGEENIGWSMVNLDEEKNQQDFSASSTTILDEEPIVNRGLAAALHLCQNKGLLETVVQKVARVKAPNKELPSAVYCIEDKMAIDDKYSRREEYRGFTQDFKEKDGYRPDVKIEYVDETGRKLCPKEAFRQLSHRFHGKGSGKMKTEKRMKKLDEEALLKKMSSSDTPLGTVALLQEKQKAQKTPYIVLSGSGKSMTANTLIK
ncbi:U4/U6.U5 tri-snRNP-associated protein 1 [Hyla sarda]|uniref:U4/U6.U5 tri-snRNP-associated protein 1 n=1 Tax=Hyla sarda TaxID=327740 RepID=UPI0024C414E3|nr:U4/U6.U5 tri-snRNP-associated protein 1 [Hyla sarda]XP_056383313.1 U4/U6.U5 tri-snRNP-associated protein 1 [Hyla sarda]XP_056383314.1 U4/U6.U5 tri-snRNP-associated protein 1 [Hyla sarda]